jgi:hypothetical protein
MTRMKLLAMAVAALLAAGGVAGWMLGAGEESTQASPTLSIGVDANPAGNTATSVGTIDVCTSVSNGAIFHVDIFITDVTDLLAWEAYFVYDRSVINVIDRKVDMFLAANTDSNVVNLSEAVPNRIGLYRSGAADIECTPDTPAPCEDGSGVVARLTLQAVGPGVSSASLPLLDLDGNTATDVGPILKDLNSQPLGDANGDAFFDGPIFSAWIAVDQACPSEPPPTPNPWPTPSPSATGTPTPAPSPPANGSPPPDTPTPAPGTVILAAGWNDSCYVGADQPIEDALAGVLDRVLAVYQMRSDQGFDRWFAGKPHVSTITSLSAYDQLFLLMSQSATWVHEPSGTPPTSVALASGWNSVCYTGATKDIEAAVAGIAGQFGVIYTLTPDQTWRRFVPGRPDVSNLSRLDRFTAVLILVTEEGGGTWAFDG